MGEDIPEWAFDRALELGRAETQDNYWSPNRHYPSVRALARYIAEHEQEPVDPLLELADNMAAGHYLWADDAEFKAAIDLAHLALKRGMELARQGEPA